MLLSKYKENKKVNIVELAKKFGVSHQTMYVWMKEGAEISGKTGERKITKVKTLAEEKE